MRWSIYKKVGKEMEVADIWCELRLPRAQDSTEPQLLQASLDNFGGLFDWLDANFEVF